MRRSDTRGRTEEMSSLRHSHDMVVTSGPALVSVDVCVWGGV